MSKFKKGDIVKFKRSNSPNSGYFHGPLHHLTIISISDEDDGLIVGEFSGNGTWFVSESEVELQYETWREKYGKVR